MNNDYKNISKYIKNKYPGRYTLKISQASNELRMDNEKVKDLIKNRTINTLSINNIAKFIVNNPPKFNKEQL